MATALMAGGEHAMAVWVHRGARATPAPRGLCPPCQRGAGVARWERRGRAPSAGTAAIAAIAIAVAILLMTGSGCAIIVVVERGCPRPPPSPSPPRWRRSWRSQCCSACGLASASAARHSRATSATRPQRAWRRCGVGARVPQWLPPRARCCGVMGTIATAAALVAIAAVPMPRARPRRTHNAPRPRRVVGSAGAARVARL